MEREEYNLGLLYDSALEKGKDIEHGLDLSKPNTPLKTE
jgi:hypothetical protein